MQSRDGHVLSYSSALRELFRVLRGRLARRLLCLVFAICLVTCTVFWAGLAHTMRHVNDCTELSSRLYLQQLCSNYSAGLLTGSLCRPLCDSREITFLDCLGHGVKLHVFLAEWRGYKVVLKSPSKAATHSEAVAHVEAHFTQGVAVLTKKQFIKQANTSIFLDHTGATYAPSTLRALEEIFTECDIGQDGVLGYSEAVTCWQLLHTEELLYFLLLRESEAMLDTYGTCGALYAVQYASSDPFRGYKSRWEERRAWSFRVRLALTLLELVESLESTPYGTLYLCDVQEANFGVAKRADGTLVAKTIDADLCWFEKDLLRIFALERGRKPCETDQDCAMVSCEGACNTTSGTCSGRLLSNNLKSLCRRIFLPRTVLHPALLRNPPEDSKAALEAVLLRCAQEQAQHLPQQIMAELRHVLRQSISQTT